MNSLSEQWWDSRLDILRRSDEFKFRWGERGKIRARYFEPNVTGIRRALYLLERLEGCDIMALSMFMRLKGAKIFIRPFHSIESYEGMLKYFLMRMVASNQ